jgi:hypothetical protein
MVFFYEEPQDPREAFEITQAKMREQVMKEAARAKNLYCIIRDHGLCEDSLNLLEITAERMQLSEDVPLMFEHLTEAYRDDKLVGAYQNFLNYNGTLIQILNWQVGRLGE